MSERSAGLSFKLGRDERLTGIRRHTFDPVEVLLWALLNELSVGFSSHKPVLDRILPLLEGEGLDQVGKGADMVAYSRDDLNFVIKFPFDDGAMTLTPYFSPKIVDGFFLAQTTLGGLFAPMTDFPTAIEDGRGKTHFVSMIVQQKVRVAADVIDELRATNRTRNIAGVERAYVKLSQRAWSRGIFDTDPNWLENTGFMPDGQMVMIDVGEITKNVREFPYYEGIERRNCYVGNTLRKAFSVSNFARCYLKAPHERQFVPMPKIAKV
ncbi:hypothetical protein A2631_02315 [Candidatus Daviesbacteria bacterium RIFCSPHIGHO2_01_FULL_44_29]|uniref:Uncharacterized protein n=1 Tax=Candidatus Daviesbacteria bacterium RIFCSPHIGHO2_02_FULL_43_12 TaxID=1797776 RepID=A0A1F5KJW4_9BACT|nr:MAG: hypothetical protein A2631_02315 [Candidatus Daviesbacteria bacterium RIFCSPHIGHO2_01_FULL_44_29]OGE40989.1 MAG: hypothetical protein A3E86_03640 [Candidatus Daviesbacteria bacterium RIFCSPHIGHO2_12_FULL_47_45]OGE41226.1 MAG: hypothetical protein A3D25_01710 [Candidatus Daviesbacteria bacterium RIFCSPHIGHO2_02_FULL_43_12]OGE69426.1 MAG: hypothetical protein A3B55_03450 [Candidatus Daviesbacteria bacterium RIFCSPLOWO2_01_FULL_43_15]